MQKDYTEKILRAMFRGQQEPIEVICRRSYLEFFGEHYIDVEYRRDPITFLLKHLVKTRRSNGLQTAFYTWVDRRQDEEIWHHRSIERFLNAVSDHSANTDSCFDQEFAYIISRGIVAISPHIGEYDLRNGYGSFVFFELVDKNGFLAGFSRPELFCEVCGVVEEKEYDYIPLTTDADYNLSEYVGNVEVVCPNCGHKLHPNV